MAETKVTKYQSNGEDIELSESLVQRLFLKGNKKLTPEEASRFIALCAYKHLNPYLNEAYIIKFGEEAQIVVSKEAFLKRAEAHPQYDGMTAGIIAMNEDGNFVELEGCFLPPKAILVGAWAKVFRKDRSCPIVAKINLTEYDMNKGIWLQKKSTMIAKVAKSQALRESFPESLGAMYAEEEQDITLAEEVKEDVKKQGSKKVNIKAPFEDAEIIED